MTGANYEIIEKLILYLKENYNIECKTNSIRDIEIRCPNGAFYIMTAPLDNLERVYELMNSLIKEQNIQKIEKVGGSNYEFLERFNSYLLENYSIKLSTIRETSHIPNSRDTVFRDYFFLRRSDNTSIVNYIYIPVEGNFEEQCYKIINDYLNDRSREISES